MWVGWVFLLLLGILPKIRSLLLMMIAPHQTNHFFRYERLNNNIGSQLLFCQPSDGDSGTYDNNEYNDNDDEVELAYGNRSLSWTRRYRRLIPYEEARKLAMALGCRSKEDWDDPASSGSRGKYLINRPDEMYRHHGWEGWDEFLGIMRSYEHTKHVVQSILKLRDLDDYRAFVKADTKRAAGLRIPARPEIVYRNRGTWISEEDFFGEFLEDDDDDEAT